MLREMTSCSSILPASAVRACYATDLGPGRGSWKNVEYRRKGGNETWVSGVRAVVRVQGAVSGKHPGDLDALSLGYIAASGCACRSFEGRMHSAQDEMFRAASTSGSWLMSYGNGIQQVRWRKGRLVMDCPGLLPQGFRLPGKQSMAVTPIIWRNGRKSKSLLVRSSFGNIRIVRAAEKPQVLLEDPDSESQQGEDGDQVRGQANETVCVDTTAGIADASSESLPPEGFILLMACMIGLLTGAGVVLFNVGEHGVHDLLWEGVYGPSWLRAHPIQQTWQHIVFIPVGGGIVVGVLNTIRNRLEVPAGEETNDEGNISFTSRVKAFFRPVLKAAAAVVTLGTGNSLGPEGPSVEIGASIASGFGDLLKSSRERKLSFTAAGSAAGIASGFNAAVAGCFFALESVLRPISGQTSSSLTTATIILGSVLASVVSQAGLGSEPAFRTPAYEFRSPAELPLYLLLGILCGFVSVCLLTGSAYATSVFDGLKARGVPAGILPSLGGLSVGLIALAYPEILYWGFENVEVLLRSRMPWAAGPSAGLLLQVVGAKVVATSLCRGSGLVGGVYAPSLFIGAALGSAYGTLVNYVVIHADSMYHLNVLSVAAPQAYALVGMAATLAGVCQVPFTSVLLLFELTRDYRIILPLMAAVGLSCWVASTATSPKSTRVSNKTTAPAGLLPSRNRVNGTAKDESDSGQEIVCTLDSSLCLNSEVNEEKLRAQIPVSAAMRTKFAVVSPEVSVKAAVSLMIEQKEWCVLIVGKNGLLEGILTLGDVQQEARKARSTSQQTDQRPVSKVCKSWSSGKLVTAYADMSLRAAERKMVSRGIRQVPIVARTGENDRFVIGLLDRDSIERACRAEATRRMVELLSTSSVPIDAETSVR